LRSGDQREATLSFGFSAGVAGGSAQNVPYTRGSLFFADVDARIRVASNGRRKLDDVMLPLFDRRRRGEALTVETLLASLASEIGPSVRDRFEAVLMRGETIVPDSHAVRRATAEAMTARRMRQAPGEVRLDAHR
jgi:predicted metalloprotease with PDZ domain